MGRIADLRRDPATARRSLLARGGAVIIPPPSSCFRLPARSPAWAEKQRAGRLSVEQSGLGWRGARQQTTPLVLLALGSDSVLQPELVLLLIQHGEENSLGGVWVGGERG